MPAAADSEPLRVVHVAYADAGGGAALATRRVHGALRGIGVDSTLLVRRRSELTDPSVRRIGRIAGLAGTSGRVRAGLDQAMGALQSDRTATGPRSFNLVPSLVHRRVRELDPHVVNLHWIGLSAMSIADVARLDRPVVVRLSDLWWLCGAEHVRTPDRDGWRRFVEGYSRANRPPSARGLDLDRIVWRRKYARWRRRHIHLIAPSRWMAEQAHASALWAGAPVSVIPNPLDRDLFRPRDLAESRAAFDLADDAVVLLFAGLHPLSDENKDFAGFVHVVNRIARDRPSWRVQALVAGPHSPDRGIFAPGVGVRHAGLLRPEEMAVAYSAASLLVAPSKVEAYGQVGAEAQACGTPVATYRGTGLADAVVDGSTGGLAPHGSVDALSEVALGLLDQDQGALRRRALDHAARFDARAIAERYRDEYQAIRDCCGVPA